MTPPPTYRQTFAVQSQLIAADASDYEYRVALLRLAEKLEQEKAEILTTLEKALSIIEDLPHPQNYAAADIRATLTKAGYTF